MVSVQMLGFWRELNDLALLHDVLDGHAFGQCRDSG
jgi:hypothetical protein